MTEYETAMIALRETGNLIAAAQVGIGFLQAGLIGGGLWLMRKAAGARDAQHTETMEALRQQGEALRQQGEALRALIERTGEQGRSGP